MNIIKKKEIIEKFFNCFNPYIRDFCLSDPSKNIDEGDTVVFNVSARDGLLDAYKKFGIGNGNASFGDFVRATADMVNIYKIICRWENYGKKSFILSKDLITAFQNTDIPTDKIIPSQLSLPFENFLVETSSIPLFNTREGVGGHIKINGERRYSDKLLPVECINLVHGKINTIITAFYSLNPSLVGRIYIRIKNDSVLQTTDLSYISKCSGLDESDPDDTQKVFNILFNTILYVNDPNRVEVETSFPSQLNKAGFHELDFNSRKYQFILLKPCRSYTNYIEKEGHIINKLDHRVLVRGHWRNQACGEKHLEHRMTWICPHMRGPEFSEIVNKPYLVR